MKKILLPILSLAVLTSGAFAEPKTKEAPMGNSIYRPIPKQASGEGSKSRFRTNSFEPTLFYYTRDSVIAYRYTAVATYGDTQPSDYIGPIGARFVPKDEDLPASATVRSFASVTRRAQPGVGMVAPAPVIKTTVTKKVRTTSTSTGQNDVATR